MGQGRAGWNRVEWFEPGYRARYSGRRCPWGAPTPPVVSLGARPDQTGSQARQITPDHRPSTASRASHQLLVALHPADHRGFVARLRTNICRPIHSVAMIKRPFLCWRETSLCVTTSFAWTRGFPVAPGRQKYAAIKGAPMRASRHPALTIAPYSAYCFPVCIICMRQAITPNGNSWSMI